MELNPSPQGESSKIEKLNEQIGSFVIDRRDFLRNAAAMAITANIGAAGVVGAIKKAQETGVSPEIQPLEYGDSCIEMLTCEPKFSAALPENSEAVVVRFDTPSTTTTTATTAPEVPITEMPAVKPPPIPPVELPPVPPAAQAAALEQKELQSLPNRKMPYSEFAANKEIMIANLPTIERLNQGWGGMHFYSDIEEQLEHINYLDNEVNLSIDGYYNFEQTLDRSRMNAFKEGRGQFDPKMVVWHWTGMDYRDVEHFIHSMRNREIDGKKVDLGVQGYVHSDGSAHQLTPTMSHRQPHALYMDEFSAGIEINTGDYNSETGPSPLFNYNPDTVTPGLYMAMYMFREFKIPINEHTFLSHHSGDLIFVNPYYNPRTGEFSSPEGYKPPGIRKHDVIPPMTSMLLRKLQNLESEFATAA